jgi:FKBP-type peptidyl-prolyl cis-trans isomerase SlyD
MDFNPAMAGKTLNFEGEILTVRDATDEELTNGLHGERSCSHEDCGHCSCEDCR